MKKRILVLLLATIALNCGSNKGIIKQNLDTSDSIGVSMEFKITQHPNASINEDLFRKNYSFIYDIVFKDLKAAYPGKKISKIQMNESNRYKTHIKVMIWGDGDYNREMKNDEYTMRVPLLVYNQNQEKLTAPLGDSIVFLRENYYNFEDKEVIEKIKSATKEGIQKWIQEVQSAKIQE